MEVAFLGGASGVGASCLAVRFGASYVVIDAGVRAGSGDGDRLPDLAYLQGRHVGAIFVTHAHADHIGALPLLVQSFPQAPIYASVPTIRLMEVMLADALRIMARRAADELEIPLYDEALVRRTLRALRPLQVGTQVAPPEVPGLRVVASPAGHIAGAVSLSLVHQSGHLAVSGDVSMTAQRSIPGASLPPLAEPDLLVLESTYGTRMHPNRKAEERRLALAVASGIERGGHVLIPAFALGRAQEVILILREAQERGEIPSFPIYIDGLVRQVCSVYQTFPEVLTPAVQRRIARGKDVFVGGTVRAVQGAVQREQIVDGPPACIIASSGMLSGGPSAWFARRLVEQESASILTTGYMDEESPGRALIDAAAGKRDTLQIEGRTVRLRCTVATYSLSAHADGAELAAFASALRPAQITLVHGDHEARSALQARIGGSFVVCPHDGDEISITPTAQRRIRLPAPAAPTTAGVGEGLVLTLERLPQLLAAALGAGGSGEPQLVTARSLALLWYGPTASDADEEAVAAIVERPEAHAQLVPLEGLSGFYRISGKSILSQPVEDQVRPGAVLLVEMPSRGLVPFLCRERRDDHLRGLLPEGDGERMNFAISDVTLVLGQWQGTWEGSPRPLRAALKSMLEASKHRRKTLPPTMIARLLELGRKYTLDEVCQLVEASSLVERLHVGRTLLTEPTLFTVIGSAAGTMVSLVPDFDSTRLYGSGRAWADSAGLQELIGRHLGGAEGLYRRSIDPTTGAITLSFHFPDVAATRYAEEIAALAAEAGVTVKVNPQTHQGEIVRLARQLVPGCERTPSIHQHQRRVRVLTRAVLGPVELDALRQRFASETGWQLEVLSENTTQQKAPRNELIPPQQQRQPYHQVLETAKHMLDGTVLKVGAQNSTGYLIVRFALPQIEATQHYEQLAAVAARTGWGILVDPNPNHEVITAVFDEVLPPGVARTANLSIKHAELVVEARCAPTLSPEQQEVVRHEFHARTGWTARLKA